VVARTCPLFNMPQETYNSDLALPIGLLAQTLLDAATDSAMLHLRCWRYTRLDAEIENAMHELSGFIESLPEPARSIVISDALWYHDGVLHYHALGAFLVGRDEGRLSDVQDALLELQPQHPNCTHIRHDLEMVRGIRSDP